MRNRRMIADIGGTNLRLAMAEDGLFDPQSLQVTDWPKAPEEIKAALATYLDQQGASRPSGAALAIAGPVSADQAVLLNRGFSFLIEDMRAALRLDELRVVNDFAALALSVPHFSSKDTVQLGGNRPDPTGPVAILGPGTGLGVASLIHTQMQPIPIAGEGGHITMSPATAEEGRVLDFLRNDANRDDGETWDNHVSAERVLSGPGLINLDQAVRSLAGHPAGRRASASSVVDEALRGDAHAQRALEMFCEMLGTVAGNLALTVGASGGVYVGGGIIPRFLDFFRQSRFRERFEHKGRLSGYVRLLPSFVIVHPIPAFLGLSKLPLRN